MRKSLEIASYPGSLRARLIRRLLWENRSVNLQTLIELAALERPEYAYCMLHAAELALRLGHKEVSVIEFGVAGGNGLMYMERLAERIEKRLPIRFQIYGFDNAEGLPELDGQKDLPYWFQPGMYQMDVEGLTSKLKRSKLILGNVNTTIADFLEKFDPAPIGAISHDLDFYSSTTQAFKLFDLASDRFLPRVFNYFDDIIGTQFEMYGEFNGQLLAMDEFNKANGDRKIHQNRNLVPFATQPFHGWYHKIYYMHVFDHPKYRDYVGGEEQDGIITALKNQALG